MATSPQTGTHTHVHACTCLVQIHLMTRRPAKCDRSESLWLLENPSMWLKIMEGLRMQRRHSWVVERPRYYSSSWKIAHFITVSQNARKSASIGTKFSRTPNDLIVSTRVDASERTRASMIKPRRRNDRIPNLSPSSNSNLTLSQNDAFPMQ